MGKKKKRRWFSTLVALLFMAAGLVALGVNWLEISTTAHPALYRIASVFSPLIPWIDCPSIHPWHLVPFAVLSFAFGLGIFAIRKNHPFSIILYPILAAMYLTAVLYSTIGDPSATRPGFLADVYSYFALRSHPHVRVALLLLLEAIVLYLVSLPVGALNRVWRKSMKNRELREAKYAKEHAAEIKAAEEAEKAAKEKKAADREARRQAKIEEREKRREEKRQAREEKREAALQAKLDRKKAAEAADAQKKEADRQQKEQAKTEAREARKQAAEEAFKKREDEKEAAAQSRAATVQVDKEVRATSRQLKKQLREQKKAQKQAAREAARAEKEAQNAPQPSPAAQAAASAGTVPSAAVPDARLFDFPTVAAMPTLTRIGAPSPLQRRSAADHAAAAEEAAQKPISVPEAATASSSASGGRMPLHAKASEMPGIFQEAVERVNAKTEEKAHHAGGIRSRRTGAEGSSSGRTGGLLLDAVRENLKKNKDISSMGSSFSKIVPDDESEVMKPVELQEQEMMNRQRAAEQAEKEREEREAAYLAQQKSSSAAAKKPRSAQPEAQEEEIDLSDDTESPASVMADEPEPAPRPQPSPQPAAPPRPVYTSHPAPQPAPHPAAKDSGPEDLEDDLDVSSGIGGLVSANGGKSALIARGKLDYHFPTQNVLKTYPEVTKEIDPETQEKGNQLVETLAQFNVPVTLTGIVKGPTVTMFEILPDRGVLIKRITQCHDNIMLNLAASHVRIVAPIPGKNAVGIEIPNKKRATVGFREMLPALDAKHFHVPMILGRNLFGELIAIDVYKTPHLLIAGATGSGKSVCVNSLICSILYKCKPSEVRMIMVDPKVVELTMYNGIPHLLTPVITEDKRTIKALDWALYEMDRRYKLLQGLHVRNIEGYNDKIKEEKILREKLPYIVFIIDEFADLMHTVGKELEQRVSRLTAMSRAVGIHLVLATQRPSTDVVTGVIKANIPSQIAFAVNSQVDSRVIIGQGGAEELLGRGDMLYVSPSRPDAQRIQGAFLSDEEVEAIVEDVKKNGEPDYIDESFFEDEPEADESAMDGGGDYAGGGDDDDLYQQALAIVVERKCASASYLQRRLHIGYNNAANLVERMEDEGIVGPPNGSKPRPILHYPGSPGLDHPQDAGTAPTEADLAAPAPKA